MINFRQKEYSSNEYDAMRSLYVELMRGDCRLRVEIIDRSQLIPVLRGNNVVIERFVIVPVGRQDKFRMYLKIGGKAKMPDQVRLTSRNEYRKFGTMKVDLNPAAVVGGNNNDGNNQQQNNQQSNNHQKKQQKKFSSILSQKDFGKKGGGGNGPKPFASMNLPLFVDINYQVNKLLGEALVYDRNSRTLVLEFDSIRDAINALNILPFGINYKLYLLDD